MFGMNKQLLDLCSDYLISYFDQTITTELSAFLDGATVSNDKISRFLADGEYTFKGLWKQVKLTIRQIKSDQAVLIVDDIIQEKAHSDVNELMHKTLMACYRNQLEYRYILANNWFSLSTNMRFISLELNNHFIFTLKSNRAVALSMEDKKAGSFVRVDSLDYPGEHPLSVWIKGVNSPVLLHLQVFINKDNSVDVLYLACSNLQCTLSDIEAIYNKRWQVEVFHKTIKSNSALAKSPTKIPLTQGNHVFMSIYGAFKLELLSLKDKMKHFALKSKLYIKTLKLIFCEFRSLKWCNAHHSLIKVVFYEK